MKRKMVLMFTLLLIFSSAAFTPLLYSQESAQTDASSAASMATAIKYIAAAIAVGLSCVAGGMAVGRIGAAAMGAMSENPELSGKALPYAGLAEGICLWGFLVALLILIL